MWRNNVAKYQIVNSPILNMNYIYELPMKVRDYECDLQGIVNNANYQHYLEHTRHEFLLSAASALPDCTSRGRPGSGTYQYGFQDSPEEW